MESWVGYTASVTFQVKSSALLAPPVKAHNTPMCKDKPSVHPAPMSTLSTWHTYQECPITVQVSHQHAAVLEEVGRIELDKQVPHAGLQPLHQLSPNVEFPGVGGLLDLQTRHMTVTSTLTFCKMVARKQLSSQWRMRGGKWWQAAAVLDLPQPNSRGKAILGPCRRVLFLKGSL